MFTQEDKHAIVWEGAEGLFQSKHTMVRFAEHSMVVSKIPTANEEGSVDGTRVARKSGPSWFGYRTKEPSYELWVSHSGAEITRNGMLDWTIDAESKV
ncbi:unnamed protein product [Ectocarpus sp. CCAP 1310/34]|nr:unnamed protein product [Ectocarpus sp. CCAP 1310/34]